VKVKTGPRSDKPVSRSDAGVRRAAHADTRQCVRQIPANVATFAGICPKLGPDARSRSGLWTAGWRLVPGGRRPSSTGTHETTGEVGFARCVRLVGS